MHRQCIQIKDFLTVNKRNTSWIIKIICEYYDRVWPRVVEGECHVDKRMKKHYTLIPLSTLNQLTLMDFLLFLYTIFPHTGRNFGKCLE